MTYAHLNELTLLIHVSTLRSAILYLLSAFVRGSEEILVESSYDLLRHSLELRQRRAMQERIKNSSPCLLAHLLDEASFSSSSECDTPCRHHFLCHKTFHAVGRRTFNELLHCLYRCRVVYTPESLQEVVGNCDFES